MMRTANPAPSQAAGTERQAEGLYGVYVLAVLVLVYILNFVDRQLLSVLAEAIKRDLGISDADLGFLFGTAFAVFYAVLGLPLARLADTWNRRTLIAAGLAVWSLMTALSGLARGFLPLALCRFGVGAGEASASPAAYSLLYDCFPPRVRTTVLAIYSSGVFLGQGIGLFLGGTLVSIWARQWPDPSAAPLGLHDWQAAFMLVGTPGLLLALWTLTLREPVRGRLDGIETAAHPHPVRDALAVLRAMIPPWSLMALIAQGRSRRPAWTNIAILAGLGALVALLVRATGDAEQWIALGAGTYAVVAWAQNLRLRDPDAFGQIFGAPALQLTVFGAAATNFMLSGYGFWTVPYFQRQFGLSAAEAGLMVGGATAAMGFIGVTMGGYAADRLRARHVAGKLVVVLVSLLGSLASAIWLLAGRDPDTAFHGTLSLLLFSSAGLGPCVSTLNDLVTPRVRATTSAFGFMVTYLVAGALGPYLVGKVSDALTASGVPPGEALGRAMAASLLIPVAGVGLVLLAIRALVRDASRRDRAAARHPL